MESYNWRTARNNYTKILNVQSKTSVLILRVCFPVGWLFQAYLHAWTVYNCFSLLSCMAISSCKFVFGTVLMNSASLLLIKWECQWVHWQNLPKVILFCILLCLWWTKRTGSEERLDWVPNGALWPEQEKGTLLTHSKQTALPMESQATFYTVGATCNMHTIDPQLHTGATLRITHYHTKCTRNCHSCCVLPTLAINNERIICKLKCCSCVQIFRIKWFGYMINLSLILAHSSINKSI